MRLINENPVPVYDELLTGYFREGRSYRTVRQSGTSDWLLILTLSGSGRFGDAGGGETIAGQGDAVLIKPGTKHDYGIAPGLSSWELLWAHFMPRPLWLPWLRWPERAPGLMLLGIGDPAMLARISKRFAEADRLTRSAVRGHELLAMNAIEEVVLWFRSLCDDPEAESTDARIAAAQHFMREHLRDSISLTDIANRSGISAPRLSRLYSQQLGTTPMKYLEELRMQRARHLLTRTSQSVGRIAEEVGFENPFYFTLRFKRATGLPPTEFRKRSTER